MGFSFNVSTREVLEQVIREPRFQALTKLPLFAPMEILLGLGAFGLFFTGTWLYVTNTINIWLMLLMNSIAIYASFTPLHDATHRSVSSNRAINDLIGTICCLLLLPGITTRIYRYLHLEHHRYAGNPAKDPDESFVSAPPWALPFILAGLDVYWSLWYFRHWKSRPKSERLELVACLTFYVGVHIGFLSSAYALEFFLCFMIPQRLGLFYVAWFFAHIQHPEGVEWEQTPFQTTVRIKTNALTRWLLLGQSLHCLHHLAPSIPYYRYQKAWDLGEHLFKQQNVPTRTLWRESTDLQLPVNLSQNWFKAKVTNVTSVAEGVSAFELSPCDTELWPPVEAGAHIDVKMRDGLVRQYSLCNAPAEQQTYRIAVKQDLQGKGGSAFMHRDVKQGSTLMISAPRNNFPLADSFGHYVLIAGGIGITPLLAMAYELHNSNRSFELHVFAKDKTRIAFFDELKNLPFSNAIAFHCDDPDVNEGINARALIKPNIKTYRPGDGLYLCGPTGFMAEVIATAKQHSWPSEHLFSETFVPTQADETRNKAFQVKIASTGEMLDVAADEQLIDVLHQAGYPVMCSCTQGICGSCITPVLEGVPEHRDAIMSNEQRSTNDCMTVCVSRAQSKLLVLGL